MTKYQRLLKFPTLKDVRIITYFHIHSFMQNKANFRNDKMNITIDMEVIYEKGVSKSYEKTKPIQSQNKPN